MKFVAQDIVVQLLDRRLKTIRDVEALELDAIELAVQLADPPPAVERGPHNHRQHDRDRQGERGHPHARAALHLTGK